MLPEFRSPFGAAVESSLSSVFARALTKVGTIYIVEPVEIALPAMAI
jgi:hypothetical protein